MNKDTKFWLGLILVVMAVFYKKGSLPDIVAPKLDKPSPEVVEAVSKLEKIENAADSNKVAAVFNAISEGVDSTDLKNNLDVQYFLDFVGKNTLGNEVVGKYPKFAPSAAQIIADTIGPQDDPSELTDVEKVKLKDLFYGFSWRLYKGSEEKVFDDYKVKAKEAIDKYNNVEPEPEPEPDLDDCPCEGKKVIVHGDGHRTECPCVASGKECKCTARARPQVLPQIDCSSGSCKIVPTISSSDNGVPNIPGYQPKVGVAGMTLRDHLVLGAPGFHDPLPASYVDSLTRDQQEWLHDKFHNETGTKQNSSSTSRTRRRLLPWRR